MDITMHSFISQSELEKIIDDHLSVQNLKRIGKMEIITRKNDEVPTGATGDEIGINLKVEHSVKGTEYNEKQKCFTVSFIEFDQPIHDFGNSSHIAELKIILKKREIPMIHKERFEHFISKLQKEGGRLTDHVIDLFLRSHEQ